MGEGKTNLNPEENADENAAPAKGKNSQRTEMILLFVLAFLIGIAVKTEAVKKITIGFDDYKLPVSSQNYDINTLQKDLIEKATEAAADSANENQPASENPDENQPATEDSQSVQ
jgi:hypothetical protein